MGSHVEKAPRLDIEGLVFSPDGKVLYAGHMPALLRWDAATGKELPALKGAREFGFVRCLPAPDGRRLVGIESGDDRFKERLCLLDGTTGRVLRRLPGELRSTVRAWAFSADSRTLAVSNDVGVALWETASGRERGSVPTEIGYALALAFSPDGRL